MQQEEFVNKVANSGLLTIDLETYYPKEEVVSFDLKDYLFMGLILKEKDFRAALKEKDFTTYQNKIVCIECTADAIIPIWAYMLVAAYIEPYTTQIVFGNTQQAIEKTIINNLNKINIAEYQDQRVVVKGCGEKQIGESVYVEITKLLRPIAKSIMYGEPCSTVPIFKAK
jgi:Protein of unknown function (DUF2480)